MDDSRGRGVFAEMVRLEGEPVARLPYEDDVSFAVIEAVSVATGEPPTEIGPLSDAIDPEALNELFAPTFSNHVREEGRVHFSFEGYSVVVDAGRREVRVYG